MKIEEVIALLEEIRHPAIDFTLVELGILTEIKIVDTNVSAVFAFPFAKIPIADNIINSVAITLSNFNIEFVHTIRTMSETEKKRFLKLENQAWKGL